jgi:hypothetical protein
MFAGSQQTIVVHWQHPSGLQTAEASARYELAPSWPEVGWSCGRLLSAILLALWLICAIITALRTDRFPRGSVAQVIEDRQLPRYLDLRHWNWTFLRSLFPWRAWLGRPPHERTNIEGIEFQAAPNGAMILFSDTQVEFLVLRLGQSYRELLDINPRLDRLKVIWNDEIERVLGPRFTIKLVKSMGSRSG